MRSPMPTSSSSSSSSAISRTTPSRSSPRPSRTPSKPKVAEGGGHRGAIDRPGDAPRPVDAHLRGVVVLRAVGSTWRALAAPPLWLVTVAWITLLLAYSLLVPLFRAPDELQHVDLVLSAREQAGYGEYDSTFIDQRLAVAAGLVGRPGLFTTGRSAERSSLATARPWRTSVLGAPGPRTRRRSTHRSTTRRWPPSPP